MNMQIRLMKRIDMPQAPEGVAVVPHGGRHAERALHEGFIKYRLCGEWFEWNSEFERMFT